MSHRIRIVTFSFFVVAALVFATAPSFVFADGLVKCNGPLNCDLCALIVLMQDIITFLLEAAFVIGAAFIAWGGILMMTDGGSGERLKQGKEVFKIAVIGVALTILSWLIISTFIGFVTTRDLNPFGKKSCTVSVAPGGGGPPGGGGTTTPPVAGTSTPPTTPPTSGEKYSGYDEVKAIFDKKNIGTKAECPPGTSSNCVEFDNIQKSVVQEVLNARGRCSGCTIFVSAGSEGTCGAPHSCLTSYNHTTGYKLDVRPDPALDNWIRTNSSSGSGTLSKPYISPTGGKWVYEGGSQPHWDITAP